MFVQLTDAGAALIASNAGPIQIPTFKLGSASNYTPSPTDTNIHGTLIFTGSPSVYVPVNANVVKYSAYLDYNLGPFDFGEIGLFTEDGTLFALGANDILLHKLAVAALTVGNSIRMDIYLSMVGNNYEMWLDLAESNNSFRMAVLGSVDQLPQPQDAIPNVYIISGKTAGQAAFEAYTDRSGLWNFDAYAYANQATATITAFDSQSVTIAAADYVPGMDPAYPGAVILEFSTGSLYGTCRYVTTVVQSGSSYTLGFDNPLMLTPQVGDKFVVFGRQALSTTIPNLPIASSTVLGAIKVGTSLTISADGVLDVGSTAYPVLSVNGQTGEVELTASDIPGLAVVAITGNYNDLINKPVPYTLPIASLTTVGGVKAPSDGNLSVAGDGTIDLGFSPVKSVNGTAPDPSTGDVTVSVINVGLVNPVQIANGTDFNSLQTTGLFFVLDADAASMVNSPNTASGGTLDVEPFTTTATGGDVIQRYTQAGSMFFRRYTASTTSWSPWATVQTASGLPIATTAALGAVIIGTGLNVTGGGVLSTQIQTVNGKNDQFLTITATDIGAMSSAAAGQQGGVAQLDQLPTGGTADPTTDPYTYGRLPFIQNTLGTWWNAGSWDANANHVIQTGTGLATPDVNTSLLDTGLQLIDLSYNGAAVIGVATPDYQTVSAEGMVYKVTVAGTTNLDGIASWAVGDLAVVIGGKWYKIAAGSTLPIATASVLGGVKKGTGLDVAGDGTLSVTGVTTNSGGTNPGYRTNSDGSIEMWGTATFATGTNTMVVALPLPVPGIIMSAQATATDDQCYPFSINGTLPQVPDDSHITVYAPANVILSDGTIGPRPASTTCRWRLICK